MNASCDARSVPRQWEVLADLSLDARPHDVGVLVVATNARRVAAHLGIGKDTAARALRRLCASGLLRRRPQAIDAVGRFSDGEYELCVAASTGLASRFPGPDTAPPCPDDTDTENDPVWASPVPPAAGARPPSSPRRKQARREVTGEQLCLVDSTGNPIGNLSMEPAS